MKIYTNNYFRAAALLFLIAATVSVYSQVKNHDFINLDDHIFVTKNPHVQKGLDFENIKTVMSNPDYYGIQLSMLSHMFDREFFGLDAGKHHLVNALIHLANTILLFVLFFRMTGEYWKSLFIAAVFGLHPINIESVAWIAERRNVLSTFFWILTMHAYAAYIKKTGILRYSLIVLFFILGLMSKPMLVTLPFVLLLMDYWPLKRFHSSVFHSVSDLMKACKPLVFEKLPLFAISIVGIVATLIAVKGTGMVRGIGGMASLNSLPLMIRIENTFVSYIKYVYHFLWPFNLSVFYPYPHSIPARQSIGAFILVVLITSMIIVHFKKHPWLFVGWFWYLGTFIPVIGLVQLSGQELADRYAYVPFIGLFIIIAWGAPFFVKQLRLNNRFLPIAMVTILSIFMISTWDQVSYWKNSKTLFQHALKTTRNNFVAHVHLAMVLIEEGSTKEAEYHIHKALEIEPQHQYPHQLLGDLALKKKQFSNAIRHYRTALRINPKNPEIELNIGIIMSEQNRFADALIHMRKVIHLSPDYAEAYSNIGVLLKKMGKLDEAKKSFLKALELKPDYAKAHYNLGVILDAEGDYDQAVRHFKKAVHLSPDYAEAYSNIGALLKKMGKLDEAKKSCLKALELKPDYAMAHNNLGAILDAEGDYDQAVRHFKKAIAINPVSFEAYNNLGSIYIKKNDIDQAIVYYQKALELNPDSAILHKNLGVAFCRNNKIEEAIHHFRETLKIEPKLADAEILLQKTMQINTQFKSAIEQVNRQIAKSPKNPTLHFRLGNLYKQIGAVDQAMSSYKKALSYQPDSYQALNALAIAYSDMKQYDQSIETYKKLLVSNPHKGSIFYNIACLYAKAQNTDQAIQYLNKALQKGYNNWELIQTDRDLENIRHTAEYKKIIIKSQ